MDADYGRNTPDDGGNAHGAFMAHAYQYSRELSIFLVKVDPDTWRRAGLDRKSADESCRLCAEIFRPELGSNTLLSNRSLVSSGFILGGVVGGALAAVLIPSFGWQAVFFAGAIAPAAPAVIAPAGDPNRLLYQACSPS